MQQLPQDVWNKSHFCLGNTMILEVTMDDTYFFKLYAQQDQN